MVVDLAGGGIVDFEIGFAGTRLLWLMPFRIAFLFVVERACA